MPFEDFVVADADMHVFEPADLWQRYIAPEYRHAAPVGMTELRRDIRLKVKSQILLRAGPVAPLKERGGSGIGWREEQEEAYAVAEARGWDGAAQLDAMVREGIDLTVLFPTRGLFALGLDSSEQIGADGLEPEFAAAIARAYNDWLQDFRQIAPDRLHGAAMVAPHHIQAAVAETRRCVEEYGFKAIYLAPGCVNRRPWHHRAYDPLWAECERLGIPVCFHGGGRTLLTPDFGLEVFADRLMMWHTFNQPLGVMCLDPTRNSVEERIETLRAETQRTRMGDAPLTSPPVVGATTGGAPAESRYEILGELGRGGMGVVYRARDTRLNRIVALKQLPDNLRDNAVAAQLFLREAQAAASLNHRNIVTVYDAGEENGVYHITMELLEGLPLSAIQERRGTLGVGDTAGLGLQVCAGLDYAHTQRIVHRDIKTANLFFTRDRVVKIMDFGLAKTIEEVRKNSTVIGGTPYYMAPEQAAGEPVDNRTDLYAFGITLYRLLTGTFPFTDGSVEYHHRHTPPPDPREHVAEICEDMARLVLDLLEKDPELRPATAADVAARLQAIRQEATKSA